MNVTITLDLADVVRVKGVEGAQQVMDALARLHKATKSLRVKTKITNKPKAAKAKRPVGGGMHV